MTNKLLPRENPLVALLIVALCIGVMRVPRVDVYAADKPVAQSKAWNPKAAAQYLEAARAGGRVGGERKRPRHALRRCHTQASYALARPTLRSRAGERAPTAQEQVMLASVEKRVRAWKDVQPFYSDAVYGAGKEVESRNAESVLNAFILGCYDVAPGTP